MRRLTAVTFLFVILSASPVTAQTRSSSGEKRIDALVSAAELIVYSEDGAADGTVMENPTPEVRATRTEDEDAFIEHDQAETG
jgi:hypothetical protein